MFRQASSYGRPCWSTRPWQWAGYSTPYSPAAVGIECAHVGSLVHDDIIDRDTRRRGRASVHSRDGVPRRGVRDQRPGVRGRLCGAHFHG
ncbi:polyprenyl synthetase family protein [Streptomyces mauvecolor]